MPGKGPIRKARRKVKLGLNKDKRTVRNRTIVREAKDIPCMDCGIKYPYYVMDLDHRLGVEKGFGLNLAVSTRKSVEAILAEIAKCDVVCANCHRERTHMRLINCQ